MNVNVNNLSAWIAYLQQLDMLGTLPPCPAISGEDVTIPAPASNKPHLPPGFATAVDPNGSGSAKLTDIENYLAELGNPADACHLFIIQDAATAFTGLSDYTLHSIAENGSFARFLESLGGANSPSGAYKMGKPLPNGNLAQGDPLPDTDAFKNDNVVPGFPTYRGTPLTDLPAIIEGWRKTGFYPKRPDVGWANFGPVA